MGDCLGFRVVCGAYDARVRCEYPPSTLLAALDDYPLTATERGVAERLVTRAGGSHLAVTASTKELAAAAGCAPQTAGKAKRTLIGLGVVQAATARGSADLLWLAPPALWQPPALLADARGGRLRLPARPGPTRRS